MIFVKGHIPLNKGKTTGKYIPCDNCGIVIYKLPCELKTHKHHFCSLKCNAKFLKGKTRSDDVKRKIGDKNRGKPSWAKGKTFVSADPIECAYLYQAKNLCIEDIAKRFKCYYRTIRERLKSCGVLIKSTKERINTTKGRFRKVIDNEKLLDLYLKQEFGMKEIAGIFDCDSCVIKHRLEYLGITIRGHKEASNMERCKGKQQHDLKGYKHSKLRSKEHCEIIRQLSIARWKDPKTREKMMAGARKGMEKARTSPSSLELEVMKLVPGNVKYTGNRKFWIPIKNGKYKNRNPDFIVEPFKKTKKVIEVLGGYFHDPITTKELWWNHEERIKNEYKSAGVKCLCIWYFDLKDDNIHLDNVIDELRRFCNGC